MLFDSLKDFKETITERIRNPFTGTLILTWLIHNWDLVFMVFDFDKDSSLYEKSFLINQYIDKAGISGLLWIPIGLAFLAIILYLTLSNLSYIIFTWFSIWVRPRIYEFLNQNTKLVTKEAHDGLRRSFTDLQTENEVNKESLSKQYSQMREKDNTIQGLRGEIAVRDGQIKTMNEQNDLKIQELQRKIDAQKNETDELTRMNMSLYDNVREFNLDMGDTLEQIFKGTWKCEYKFVDGRGEGSELFIIRGDEYFVLNTDKVTMGPTFKLTDIIIDKKKRMVEFTKNRIVGPRDIAKNILSFVNDRTLIGKEPKVEVKYTREY